MFLLPLSGKIGQGQFAIIDDEYVDLCQRYKWYLSRRGYALTGIYLEGKRRHLYLHHLVCPRPEGMCIDHIDRVKLNCLKANLRVATITQNNRNRDRLLRNKSGYIGVSWYKRFRKYRSGITYNRCGIAIGYFDDAIEAAYVYDQVSLQLFGEFAHTNLDYGEGRPIF